MTGLTGPIIGPTRLDSTIDLVYTNRDCFKTAGTLDFSLSDYNPLFVTRKKIKTKTCTKMFYGWSYANYHIAIPGGYQEVLPMQIKNNDKDTFQQTLKDYDWFMFFKLILLDQRWDYIENQISAGLDPMCPLRKRLTRNTCEPWLSSEIIEFLHDKDRAWKKASKFHSEVDMLKAKQLQNQTKTTVRQAKANYIQEEIDRNKDDPKKL